MRLTKSPRDTKKREVGISSTANVAREEKERLRSQVGAALETWLREVQKSSPDVLSVAVVDEVGALLASSGEVFVATEGEKFSLGTILMFIHGMAEAGSKFLGSGQVESVHVNCYGGKWFVIRLGGDVEARGLLGIKTTLEANLAAVMLDARRAAENITALMAETEASRRAFFEAPKRLSKLTAEDMAAWWGLRFKTLDSRKKELKTKEQENEEVFSIKDYWDEALQKVKKKSPR
jgi:predicted regulator of Ras-like GTPase activity (Roadblock/LC7/MglB family)